MKHRILLQTNPIWIKTGLAENARTLLKYLYKTGKYDIAHYCSQVSVVDPNLSKMPWKTYGSIPNDQRLINELNQDPNKARAVSYGGWNIDNVIKDFKPTIWIGSDDIWGFPKSDYIDKAWYKQINSILHITADSLPILEQAYEQAEHTKHYITWAKFAQKEMKRFGPKFAHVSQIYGAMDITKFSPISDNERLELRRRFGISPHTTIFLFVGRNQLRKQFVQCIEAFAHFKKEHPQADVKLHFHTSFSEKGNGWDIPKMSRYYGVNPNDILCTYVCKKCGNWFVAPYQGEDINCPYCNEQKSVITANIVHGVPDEQMKYIYGLSDACISAFSSGGQEYHNSQSLLCGKPLASTNYSSGEDFCEQDFVFTLNYSTYVEQGTNFIKSTTNTQDIKKYMFKVWKMSKKELLDWGERGRKWAVDTFSIESVGKKWEELFDSLPIIDWEKVDLTPQRKNDTITFPTIEKDTDFITYLYKEILKMDEKENGDGHKHWMAKLKEGAKREDIYNYFISVAKQENAKNFQQQDFWSVIDKREGKKRGMILVKESIGDIILATSLLESFHQQHPDTDLYFVCDPKFFDILVGNPYIYKLLPYHDMMEQEMVMTGSGQNESYFDYYYHVCVQTQRLLTYLSQPKPAFDLCLH